MGKVLAYMGGQIHESGDRDESIGVFEFTDRKKPCIGYRNGNKVTVYGSFNSAEAADKFMNKLAEFLKLPLDEG